jgi:polyisoprenoid-binding protein YceI
MRGTIKTAGLDTHNQERNNHLRSADFFDVTNSPEITFASKRVEMQKQGHALIGDLTIRGVTKEVAVPFSITGRILSTQTAKCAWVLRRLCASIARNLGCPGTKPGIVVGWLSVIRWILNS